MPDQQARHPFVPFHKIISGIADKYIRTTFEKKVFSAASKLWAGITGIAKHEKRIADAFARGENGYASTYKRFSQIYYPEFSATCIMNDQAAEDPARKASKLIVGALDFRARVLGNQLEVDREVGKPLDMQRYQFIFSRLAISSLSAGRTLHAVTEMPPSEHIIVAVDSIYYKLQVLRGQQIIPLAEIYQQINRILDDAQSQLSRTESDRFPFGLFTVMPNKETIPLFDKLAERCPHTIQQLNHALFFVAIDIHDQPQSLEKLGRVVHGQNFSNRDYRRSMQLVVTGNGYAGLVGDPNAGIGGGFSGRFLDELAKSCRALEGQLPAAPDPAVAPLFQRLTFNREILSIYQDQLTNLRNKVLSQFYAEGFDSVFRLEGIGKKDFARFAVSTDGIFHAALHLAFKRCFGKIPYVGNFIGLRVLQHGEIFRANATTPEMKKFVNNPNIENLHTALNAHKAVIKKIKQGEDEFYQCEMLLVTLFNRYEIGPVPCLLFIGLLGIFIEDFNRRFMSPDMWVSHIPEFPGVALTGRPGVKLSFLEKPAMAGHYTLFDHHTTICFVGNPGAISYYGQEAKFAAALRDALCELRQMLVSQGGQLSPQAN